MGYQLNSITWDAPRPVDSSCTATLLQGLEYEVNQLIPSQAPIPGDFYYWGGALAAQARLALIAYVSPDSGRVRDIELMSYFSENLGRNDLVTKVISYLEASFQHWFDGSSSVKPAYETAWGGVINGAGATDANVDFGNGYYNDHHFHYGYFLSIAAVIAKFDGNWLNTHRDYINWFARYVSPQYRLQIISSITKTTLTQG
jgi:endo-1,3(4)-beta-glucanase